MEKRRMKMFFVQVFHPTPFCWLCMTTKSIRIGKMKERTEQKTEPTRLKRRVRFGTSSATMKVNETRIVRKISSDIIGCAAATEQRVKMIGSNI